MVTENRSGGPRGAGGALVAGIAVIGFIGMIGFLAGVVYGTGSLPRQAYVLYPWEPNPDTMKSRADHEQRFVENLSSVVAWDRLSDMSARVLRIRPDGIETPRQAAAALLAQLLATRGTASFLSGESEHRFFLWYGPNGPGIGSQERRSPLLALADRAGYELDAARLTELNAELNMQHVAWLDRAREDAMVYRNIRGWLTLVVRN